MLFEVYSLKSKFVVWDFKKRKTEKEKSEGVPIYIAARWSFYCDNIIRSLYIGGQGSLE